MEIRPQIDISQYDINYNKCKNAVIAISNRKLNTEIKFHDMNLQEKEGYVQDSIMEIWSQKIDDETLNIVHIHVNDTSEEVTLDIAYMHPGEKIEQHQQFKVDLSGKPLKYKIIVKDAEVYKVYYNSVAIDGSKNLQEVPFCENKISTSQKYTQKDEIHQIVNIPTGMISCADKIKV